MMAGTLGPVASAFSICALVRPWRQFFIAGSGADIQKAPFIPDPKWLIVVNAIQLAIALIANLFLLLNMSRKVRFTLALPITIIGWYISSICLIALTGTAGGPLKPDPVDNYVWSQAFYYGIYSAVLYFILASLLLVTYFGAMAGHYDKDFQLTTAQRTLMLQTIMFLIYLLVGALVFSTIEGWGYLDAVYWADVTLFTVGFGDIYAQTVLGRALLIPYALIGIISLGLVIGSIRSLVLERGRRRMAARIVEKRRRRLVRRMTKKGKDNILEPVEDTQSPISPASPLSEDEEHHFTELERREAEFNLMRKVQATSAKRRKWLALFFSVAVWLTLWLVGAKIFQSCEEEYQDWSYFTAFYFAFVSLTTIGYGDVTPVSPPGKSFFVFWSLLALPTMTVLISNAGDTIVKSIKDATNQLGNVTILPGERGFKKDMKEILRALSLGKLFKSDSDSESDIEEFPPGFLGDAHPSRRLEDETEQELEEEDAAEDMRDIMGDMTEEQDENLQKADDEVDDKKKHVATDQGGNLGLSHQSSSSSPANSPDDRHITFSDDATRTESPVRRRHSSLYDPDGRSSERGTSIYQGKLPPKLDTKRAVSIPRQDLPISPPTDRGEYRVILIDEITRVLHHLKSQPPRKYSYQEWVWYLKLIGEDESSAETHRKAVPHVHAKHPRNGRHGHHKDSQNEENSSSEKEAQDEVQEEETKLQWSWIGSRSPLMGSQEEAEWILEKLTKRLGDELRDARAEDRRKVFEATSRERMMAETPRKPSAASQATQASQMSQLSQTTQASQPSQAFKGKLP